jgi:hypothetical protein
MQQAKPKTEPGQLVGRPASPGAIITRYKPLLQDWPNERSALVPQDQLPALLNELAASLVPATRNEVAKAVTVLCGCFKIANVVESPGTFAKAMIDELADYPASVLDESISQARRTIKWLPSIAEMVEICDALVAKRRLELRFANRMDMEHERRRQQEEEQERRVRADQERRAARASKLAAVYGTEYAPDEDGLIDCERGERFVFTRRDELKGFNFYLDHGETWSLIVLWCLSVVAQAVELKNQHALDLQHVADVIDMLPEKYLAARDFVLGVAVGTIKPRDERHFDGGWPALDHMTRAMVEKIRERWEVAPRGQWALIVDYSKSQGIDPADFIASNDAAETIMRLEEAEQARIAAIDVAARTREAMAELFNAINEGETGP